MYKRSRSTETRTLLEQFLGASSFPQLLPGRQASLRGPPRQAAIRRLVQVAEAGEKPLCALGLLRWSPQSLPPKNGANSNSCQSDGSLLGRCPAVEPRCQRFRGGCSNAGSRASAPGHRRQKVPRQPGRFARCPVPLPQPSPRGSTDDSVLCRFCETSAPEARAFLEPCEEQISDTYPSTSAVLRLMIGRQVGLFKTSPWPPDIKLSAVARRSAPAVYIQAACMQLFKLKV